MLSAIASTHFAFLANMNHDPGAVLVLVPALSSPSQARKDCEESCQQEQWTITCAQDMPMWWNPLGCSGSLRRHERNHDHAARLRHYELYGEKGM